MTIKTYTFSVATRSSSITHSFHAVNYAEALDALIFAVGEDNAKDFIFISAE